MMPTGRLTATNERLWSGLHPDGLSAVYGTHPKFETVQLEAALGSRSEVLEPPDAQADRPLVRDRQARRE